MFFLGTLEIVVRTYVRTYENKAGWTLLSERKRLSQGGDKAGWTLLSKTKRLSHAGIKRGGPYCQKRKRLSHAGIMRMICAISYQFIKPNMTLL